MKIDEDHHPFDQVVFWEKTDDAEYPYRSRVHGQIWTIRVNDWPEDPTVYSLLIDEKVILNFDGWGDAWNHPKA